MKKTLIALAVAGAVSAPAFAATSNVDVYGNFGLSVDLINSDTSIAGEDKKLNRVSSNSSRIGFKGTEDLGGGLVAIWQIENQLDMDNGTNNLSFDSIPPISQAGTLASGSFSSGLRNTFLGLKSDSMGTVLFGKHDTPYKLATAKLDVFADTAADYNNIVGSFWGINAFDLRPGNVAAYISPTFTGFHAAVAHVFGNELGTDAVGSAADASAWSAMGMYENGPLFASLAYEAHKNLGGDADMDNKAWKLGVGYKFGNTKLGLIYEDMDISTVGRKAWYLNVAHTMGNIVLKAAYGRAGDIQTTADTGARTYTLGADYMLSKRTTAYALYSKVSNDTNGAYGVGAGQGSSYNPFGVAGGTTGGNWGDDPSVLSIGMRHTF